MIHIEEKQTSKLPGKTSLFVNFTYNPMIVETVKQCTVANYDKKTTTWEVPLTSLSFLLDRLSQIDDVEIVLLEEEKKKQHEIYTLSNYKTKPYQYQIDGIEFGLNEDRWLLLDAPGLGKTLQLIYLAQELKEKEGIEHCLIICGLNTLKNNWKDEIHKHSDMSCMILGERKTKNGKIKIGSVQERLDDLKKPIEEFFIITNIETLRNDGVIKELKNNKNNKIDMIILDEGHVCFPKGTLISTDLGQVPIEYLVEHKTKYKVLSYNESLGITEYKRINEKFKHDNESLLCLQFELDDGSIKTLNVTKNHPIYTENRGYVPAYDITEDDILLFDDESLNPDEVVEYKQCHTYKETAEHFNTSESRIKNLLSVNNVKPTYFNKNGKYINDIISQVSYEEFYRLFIIENKSFNEISLILNISESQCRQLREYYNIQKPTKLVEDKKVCNNILKYGVTNVAHLPETRKKISNSVKKNIQCRRDSNKTVNNFKFGNGRMSCAEKIANDILLKFGFIYNKSISVGNLKNQFPDMHYPTNYKPDFYNPELKLAIEIDGANHSSLNQKELDIKKEHCLHLMGINTVRFTNDYVINNTDDFYREVVELCREVG